MLELENLRASSSRLMSGCNGVDVHVELESDTNAMQQSCCTDFVSGYDVV